MLISAGYVPDEASEDSDHGILVWLVTLVASPLHGFAYVFQNGELDKTFNRIPFKDKVVLTKNFFDIPVTEIASVNLFEGLVWLEENGL